MHEVKHKQKQVHAFVSAEMRKSANWRDLHAGLAYLRETTDRQKEIKIVSDLASELSELAIHGAIRLAVSLLDCYYCCRAYRQPVGARGRSEKQREREVSQPGKTRQGSYACMRVVT